MKKMIFSFIALVFAANLSAQTDIFYENFEGALSVTSSTGAGGGNNWAVSSRLFHGGLKSDSCTVSMNDTSYLTTNSFNATGYNFVVLEFWHICKIEAPDYAYLELSVDNGVTWTKLTEDEYLGTASSMTDAAGNRFSAGSYGTGFLWQPTVPLAVPDNSWWVYEKFNISVLAANQSNVKVRFILRDGNTSGANGNYGWIIDDLRVTAALDELDPPTITLLQPILTDTIYSTGPFTVSAQITDYSGVDTATVSYSVNGGAVSTLGMLNTGGDNYSADIPSQAYLSTIAYKVKAIDGSQNHNTDSVSDSFYTKKTPDVDEIGTGTSINKSLPVEPFYGYTYSQSIFYKDLISFQGNILKIAYHYNGGSAWTDNIVVYMGHTNKTAFSGTSDWLPLASLTQVYAGSLAVTATDGWIELELDVPFNYNGNQNLVVAVDENTSGYHSSGDEFFCTESGTELRSIYFYSDGTNPDPAAPVAGTTTLSTPNIRMYFEALMLNNDAGVVEVLQPSGTILSDVQSPLEVKIKNFAINTMTSVTVKYSLDGVLQADTFAWTGNLGQDFISNAIVIDSFMVAEGAHTIKVWTQNPNGVADEHLVNDTLTVDFYACANMLSGNYTIGTAGDFASFQDALDALTLCGISGPVVFDIDPDTISGAYIIPAISGASAVNTILFRSSTGDSTDVVFTNTPTGTANNYTIKLDAATYVSFEDVTFSSTGSTTYGRTVLIDGASSDLRFSHCRFVGVQTTSGTVDHAVLYSPGTTPANNITVEYSAFVNGAQAILLNGKDTANKANGINIRNNTFTNPFRIGVGLVYQRSPVVEGNTVNMISTGDAFGIFADNCDKNFRITSNKLNVKTSLSAIGILSQTNIGWASSRGIIANNFVTANGTVATDGIQLYASKRTDVFYNSVNVLATDTDGTKAIFITSVADSLVIRNNIFANHGGGYAILVEVGTGVNSDYNDLYTSGATLGKVAGIFISSLAQIQGYGLETHSVSEDPFFFTSSDLHTTVIGLNGKATVLTGVTTDIDGQPRDGATPDIGADEFEPLNNDLGIVDYVAPLGGCGLSASENLVVHVKNLGQNTITAFNVSYKINGGSYQTQAWSGSLAGNAETDVTISGVNMSANGLFVINAYVTLTGDENHVNDTMETQTIQNGFNFYAGDYTQSFETTEDFSEWMVLDANSDTYTWTLPYTSGGHTGSRCVRFTTSSTNVGNDYLFSNCFNFKASELYDLSFWYRSYYATYPQNVRVMISSDQAAGTAVDTVVDLQAFSNTVYQKSTGTFSVPTDGVYYLTFFAYSPTSYSYYADFDDINIGVVPANDAAVISVDSLSSGCSLSTQTVYATVANYGSAVIPSGLSISYLVEGGAPVTEAVSVAIQPNDTITYQFATPIDFSVTNDSTFVVYVYTALAGDTLLTYNDTAMVEINSLIPPPLPVTENDTIFSGLQGTLTATSPYSVIWFDALVGGNQVGTGPTFTTPVLYDTAYYYAGAVNGLADLKITEVTLYRTGTNYTPVYPAYITGADLIEITNLGQIAANLSGYSVHIFGEGARSFNLPATTLNPGEVLVLHAGTGTDDAAHKYFNMGGSIDIISSSSLSGFVLKGPATQIIDAVAANGYTFDPVATGVTATDWTGTIPSSSGYAGIIRPTNDNNLAADWVVSSGSYIQNIGTLNAGLTFSQGCISERVEAVVIVNTPDYDAGVTAIFSPEGYVATNYSNPVLVQVKNYGLNEITAMDISYEIDGGAATTLNWVGSLMPDDTMSVVLNSFVASQGQFDFCVYTTHPYDTVVRSNDTMCTVLSGWRIDTIPYSDNFDLGTLWTPTPATGATVWQIGTPAYGTTNSAHSTPNAWDVNLTTVYTASATAYLSTQVFDLRNMYNTEISFWINYNTESSYDGTRLEYTTDFGTTWKTLGIVNDPNGTNWYTGNTTGSKPGWTGTSTGWKKSEYMLDILNGLDYVQFRFVFTSDASVFYDGFSLDDFEITIPDPLDAGVFDILVPGDSVNEDASIVPQIVVKNFGSDTITAMTVSYTIDNGTPVPFSYTGLLLPGGKDTVAMPAFVAPSAQHEICAYTTLTGDQQHQNDTFCDGFFGKSKHDLYVIALVSPDSSNCDFTSTETVTFRVRNRGVDTVAFATNNATLSGFATGANPATFTVLSITSGTLLPGATADYTVSTGYDMSLDGSYGFYATIDLPTDGDPTNNTMDTVFAINYPNVSSFPYLENFESGNVTFLLANGAQATAQIDANAANASSLGLHLDGGPSTGWTGSYGSVTATNAWVNNTSHHASALSCNIDASGVSALNMKFDLKQTYSYGPDYNWFRVLVNDVIQIKDINGDSVFHPVAMSTDPFTTRIFDLSAYAGTAFSVKLQSSCKYDDVSNAPLGDNAYIDNFYLWVPVETDVAVTNIVSPATFSAVGSSKQVTITIENLGIDTLYSIPVAYQANGGTVKYGTWTGALAPYGTTNYVFTPTFAVVQGMNSICAWTDLVADLNHNNDTICEAEHQGLPVNSLPYSNDFEGTNNWYGRNTQWELGTPAASVINSAHSPTKSWAVNLDGDYLASSNDILYTSFFNFAYPQTATLTFWHWYNSEATSDGGRIEYSTDNGATWYVLGYLGDTAATNWFTHVVGTKPAWTGTSGGWVQSTYYLHQLTGVARAQFRFQFFSDADAILGNGWAIDDFSISLPATESDASAVSLDQPAGSTPTGDPVTVVFTFKNTGSDTITSLNLGYRVNTQAPVSEPWSGTLLPDSSATYTFATTFTGLVSGYNLCAYTMLSGDPYNYNDTVCETISVTAGDIDGGVTSFVAPGTQTTYGDSVTVSVYVKNFGTNALTSTNMIYTINGANPKYGTFTGALNQGDSALFTFPVKFNSPISQFVLCARTSLTGDDNPGNDQLCKTVTVVMGVEDELLSGFILGFNQPNPATEYTMIPFNLPSAGEATFTVTNITGQKVYSASGFYHAGQSSIELNTANLPAGVYLYSLEYGGRRLSQRMMIAR
ncbi:MAG: T9SS type A sorting domain-containing protein [Bacteroidetes bacterium]|nr:T9SS type A sorting domain-containing protein [Bacteroidota bacterium]MBU1718421.1 T9SS type A sorting domain-containing protein [Bacteroidota bacterium]